MINISAGKMVLKIKLVFAFVLVIGLGIAAAIYILGERISESTSELAYQDVPIYQQFQKLRNQLIEQERYLYEYYASFDETHYLVGFKEAQLRAKNTIGVLSDHFGNPSALIAIRENQQLVLKLAAEFHSNMQLRQLDGIDWDLARKQLSESSLAMRSIAPHIEKLTVIVNKQVVASQKRIDSQLFGVNFVVLLYGAVSFLFAYIMFKSIRVYLDSTNLSERLSLFPKRNPNPIISLDNENSITFINPATKKLLNHLGRSEGEASSLLSKEIIEYQSKILQSEESSSQFEYSIDDLTFLCVMHWLSDQNQWDLHLTDVSARVSAERKLNFQAYHHPETCLANQYKFREVLEQETALSHQYTLGIIEIRAFNQLLAGSSVEEAQLVVKEIAAVLDKACHYNQETIELYHIGDKSFAVRIPKKECESTVVDLVNTILREIKANTFSGQHQVNLDFGFTCFPHHGTTVDSIIHHARIALIASASEEHSDFKMFSNELGELNSRQQKLIHLIPDALAEEKFQLYFQPQMSLTDGTIIGAEVLIRWQHEDQWISPAEFIPLAERSGLIVPLGDWILDEAGAKTKQLVDLGYVDLVVAVNISPKQFAHPSFVEKVRLMLQKYNLPAKNIELEITEGVFFNNEKDSIESLHKLKKIGVQLSIDDFGTGYSSLSYLKQFPVDKLKIDQSFVRHMHENHEDQSIVRTIVDLGANLNLTLIAEGVEEQEQVAILKEMGCNEIQGYWFSKPLFELDFIDFLKSKTSTEVFCMEPLLLETQTFNK